MPAVLLILLVLCVLGGVGTLPTWGYSSGWGIAPTSIIWTAVVILLVLVLLGRA